MLLDKEVQRLKRENKKLENDLYGAPALDRARGSRAVSSKRRRCSALDRGLRLGAAAAAFM